MEPLAWLERRAIAVCLASREQLEREACLDRLDDSERRATADFRVSQAGDFQCARAEIN